MRISVNLATRPFVELRPLFARLRLAMGLLLLAAIGLGFGLHTLNARARQATAQMDALKSQTAAYQAELSRNEARMRQPQNKAVLDRSTFLNELFARKSFSWTATMMDLERVLPAGVQVTSIDPVITKEGDVQIRLRVSGDRDKSIQLVNNLEHSQRFIGPRLSNETSITPERSKALNPQLQNVNAAAGGLPPASNMVEFEIFSGYNPLPAARADARKEHAPVQMNAPAAIPGVIHNRHAKPSADEPAIPAPATPAPARGTR